MTQQQKKTAGFAIASLVLGLFFIIPLLGFLLGILAIVFGILALNQISKNPEQLKGKGMAIAGIVMGGLAIVLIPIIALLAAIAIPNLLRAKLAANENLAKSTLRSLSTASESYAVSNSGKYPTAVYALTGATPPYLVRNYCDQMSEGYQFRCEFSDGGYRFIATPTSPGATGSKIYTIVTKGNLTEQEAPYERSYESSR